MRAQAPVEQDPIDKKTRTVTFRDDPSILGEHKPPLGNVPAASDSYARNSQSNSFMQDNSQAMPKNISAA